VDLKAAVVIDEAEAAEFVHEKIDAGSGGADHLGKRLLAERRNDVLGPFVLAEICEQQKNPRQALFAGIKELIDQVFFDAKIPMQQIGNEQLGNFGSTWSARTIVAFSIRMMAQSLIVVTVAMRRE
jgi:hypothetical protein